MLNLRKLIDMLPYYYKGADTYKNKEGKGIFERYLDKHINGAYEITNCLAYDDSGRGQYTVVVYKDQE